MGFTTFLNYSHVSLAVFHAHSQTGQIACSRGMYRGSKRYVIKTKLTITGLHCTGSAMNIDGELEDTKGIKQTQIM